MDRLLADPRATAICCHAQPRALTSLYELRHGQADPDIGGLIEASIGGARANVRAAAVSDGDRVDDREAQPRAGPCMVFTRAAEAVKRERDEVCEQAGAFVLDV